MVNLYSKKTLIISTSVMLDLTTDLQEAMEVPGGSQTYSQSHIIVLVVAPFIQKNVVTVVSSMEVTQVYFLYFIDYLKLAGTINTNLI